MFLTGDRVNGLDIFHRYSIDPYVRRGVVTETDTDTDIIHRIWRGESALGTTSFPGRVSLRPRDIGASAVTATGHPHIFIRTATASKVIREHDAHGDGLMRCSRRGEIKGIRVSREEGDVVKCQRSCFIPVSEESGGVVLIINTDRTVSILYAVDPNRQGALANPERGGEALGNPPPIDPDIAPSQFSFNWNVSFPWGLSSTVF